MVHPWVSEIFAREKVGTRVNEFSVLSFASCGSCFFLTQYVSAIMHKLANAKHFKFTSKAVSNLLLQESCTVMQ